jgi:hypothetical protein
MRMLCRTMTASAYAKQCHAHTADAKLVGNAEFPRCASPHASSSVCCWAYQLEMLRLQHEALWHSQSSAFLLHGRTWSSALTCCLLYQQQCAAPVFVRTYT